MDHNMYKLIKKFNLLLNHQLKIFIVHMEINILLVILIQLLLHQDK